MATQPEILRDRLKVAREATGLSQTKAGVAIGKSRITVARWEGGDRIPKDSELGPIADLYQVTLDWLLGGPGAPPEATLERKQHAMSRYRAMIRQMERTPEDWATASGSNLPHFLKRNGEATPLPPPENLLKSISSKLSLILQAQRELPKIKGITEQVVEAMANGQVIPSMAILPELCDTLNIDQHWLLVGGRSPLSSARKPSNENQT